MTKQQLALCARILGMSEATVIALQLHYFKGHTKAEACRRTGVLPTNLTRAVKSVDKLHAELQKGYS